MNTITKHSSSMDRKTYLREYHKKWHKRNREEQLLKQKEYYRANREYILAKQKEWRNANPDYVPPKRCKAKDAALSARRNAMKLALTPPDADKQKIEMFYKLARYLTTQEGIKYQVDHIKPLVAGGLHHQCNLQVILATDNVRKGKSLTDEYIGFRLDEVELVFTQVLPNQLD